MTVIGPSRSRPRQRQSLPCRANPTRHFRVPMLAWEHSRNQCCVSLGTGKRSRTSGPARLRGTWCAETEKREWKERARRSLKQRSRVSGQRRR
ncbi:hypothetical protein NDU88_006311 [Pleurodeles waltl]|uniref:Uncharacterized protein n=1 Tax=Pleurodeles waltl TaxID=8319 RepID=A0AAV7LP78_PLEWA|nr:hypothetical protein NDU88_006311 [Pleurodeles waltl]